MSKLRLTQTIRRLSELKETPKKLRWLATAMQDTLFREISVTASNIRGEQVMVRTEQSYETNWLEQPGFTTIDYCMYVGDVERITQLYILDYKTGSIPVNPDGNDQLYFYAWTVLDHFETTLSVTFDDDFTVDLIIHQPPQKVGMASEKVSQVTYRELREWSETVLEAERKILNKDLSLRPGSHCTFCPANPRARGEKGYPLCPAMTELVAPPLIDYDEVFEDN